MTGRDDVLDEDHPHTLPWLVAGTLDPDAAAAAEEHLRRCAGCRARRDQLASLRDTIRRHERDDHVPVEDLVGFATGEHGLDEGRRAAIGRHLEGCSACCEDRDALVRSLAVQTSYAEGDVTAGRRVRSSARLSWPSLAAAAAIAAVTILAFAAYGAYRYEPSRWRAAARPTIVPGTAATWLPPQRSADSRPVLTIPGPWVVHVVLPFGAPAGMYAIAVAGESSERRPGPETRAAAGPDGVLVVAMHNLPAGAHRLVVTPAIDAGSARGEAGGGAYLYPFRVEAGR